MRYRLVCLDAGFTLLAPRGNLIDALRGVLADHGHHVSDQELHRAWEVADRWFWDDYHRPDNDTWGDDQRIDDTWRIYHSLMLRELGLEDLQHGVLDTILTAQYAPESWELYPDVLPALAELRAAGLHLGIISDWGSNLLPIVEGLGLQRELDFVLASGAEGVSKPDPAFFRLAAARAGVPSGEALMVGDSYRADVEGARAAGMEAVLLARPEWRDRREAPPDGVTVISSLAELPALVAER
jgi:haloacid dehalogenase superfamily, subfamily IA, variant 3 with third motif having DD or ED/haloacid dehalogenase superfamily, subfamily IA, variant 1 with third motif having Dx(3-4)D or Dx(3-4)E